MATTPTPRLGLNKQDHKDPSWHTALNSGFDDADARLVRVETESAPGVHNPNGVVAGDYVGQPYWADEAHVLWMCSVAGAAGVAEWIVAGSQAINLLSIVSPLDTPADITAGIEAGLAMVKTDQLRYLFIPPGIWTVTGIDITLNNSKLIGAGIDRTTLILEDGADKSLLTTNLVGLGRLLISDIQLNGNRANQAAGAWAGIDLHGGRFIRIENVRILETKGDGLILSRSSSTEVTRDYFLNNLMFVNIGGSAIRHDKTDAEDVRISNVHVDQFSVEIGSAVVGISLSGLNSSLRNVSFRNVNQSAASDICVSVGMAARRWQFDNVVITGTSGNVSGFLLEGQDCVIRDLVVGIGGPGLRLAEFAHRNQVHIRYSGTGEAVQVDGDRNVISGFTDGGSPGIRTQSNALNNTIQGFVFDPAAFPEGTQNVQESGSGTRMVGCLTSDSLGTQVFPGAPATLNIRPTITSIVVTASSPGYILSDITTRWAGRTITIFNSVTSANSIQLNPPGFSVLKTLLPGESAIAVGASTWVVVKGV